MPLPAHAADGQFEYPATMHMGISRSNYISAINHILAEFEKAWTGKDVDKVHKNIKSKLRQTMQRKYWVMVGRPDLINYVFMNIGIFFDDFLKKNLPEGESSDEYTKNFDMESLMVHKGDQTPQWYSEPAMPGLIADVPFALMVSPVKAEAAEVSSPPDSAELVQAVASFPSPEFPSPTMLVKLRRFAVRCCHKHFTDQAAISAIERHFLDQVERILEWGSQLRPDDLIDSICRSFVEAVAHAQMEPIRDIACVRAELQRLFAPKVASGGAAASGAAASGASDDVVVMGNPHPHNTPAGRAFVMEMGHNMKRLWTAEGGPDHLGGIYYRASDMERLGIQALIDESNAQGGLQYDVAALVRIQNPNTLMRLEAFKLMYESGGVLLSFHSTGSASNFGVTKADGVLTHALPIAGSPVHEMAMNGVSPHCLKRVASVFGPGFYVARRSKFVMNSQYRTSCNSDLLLGRFFVVLGLPGPMRDVSSDNKSSASDQQTSFRVVDASESYHHNVFMYCTQFVSIQTYMAYVVDIVPRGHAIVPMSDPIVVPSAGAQ